MFMKKSNIAKITMGYLVASLVFFAAVMPASAAEMKFREDIGAGVPVEEEVQEDFLGRNIPNCWMRLRYPLTIPVTGERYWLCPGPTSTNRLKRTGTM